MTEREGTDRDGLALLQDSLLRRMRARHSLYYEAVETMELAHGLVRRGGMTS